jgi:hypothetical protein
VPKFEPKGAELYIDGLRVKRAWESDNGFYWFAVKKASLENIVYDGKSLRRDTIWYGLVQGFLDEWTYFSEAELDGLKLVRRIKRKDLPNAGRRN